MATTKFSTIVGQAQVVPVITEWTAYTPTGTWTTNTTYVGKKRRVGSTMEYDLAVTLSGAPNATVLSINQPSGETLLTTNASSVLGYGNARKPGVDTFGITARANNNTTVSIYVQNVTTPPSATGSNSQVNQANPFTFANTDQVQIRYSCEIVELQGFANVAQGAGLATAIRPGLYSAGANPGFLGSTAIAVGNLGERITGSFSATGVTTSADVGSVALPAGKFIGFWRASTQSSVANRRSFLSFSSLSNTPSTASITSTLNTNASQLLHMPTGMRYLDIPSAVTYFFVGNGPDGAVDFSSGFYEIVRIA